MRLEAHVTHYGLGSSLQQLAT